MMKKKHKTTSSVRLFLTLFVCSAFVLTGCTPKTDVDKPFDANNNDSTSEPSSPSSVKDNAENEVGPEGTWYEQQKDGCILTVTKDELTFRFSDGGTLTYAYKAEESDNNRLELITIDDEYVFFLDIFYHFATDSITARDLPMMDGDGGYHLHTFARTEYETPPESVYAERHDNSDLNAPKSFTDPTIRSLSFSVTEPDHGSNGYIAPELPMQGTYTYELSVNDDGSGLLSSDFCQDITVTSDQLKELESLFATGALPSLNGVDIYTEEMPGDTAEYALSIEFADGASYYSYANGKDVSEEWQNDGYAFHQMLFYFFMDAGYDPMNGEFHSTLPMKRIGFSEDEGSGYAILKQCEREERQGTAYEYNVHCDYPIFPFEGAAPEMLMDTLNDLSDSYKELALADLDRNFEEMADVPASVWKDSDICYAYSFYAMEQFGYAKNLFHFMISEGHANSFGIGKYGSGYYPSHYYCVDSESGAILSMSDLFNDTEKLCDALTHRLCEFYQFSENFQNFFTSEEFQSLLKEAVLLPHTEGGIGVSPSYDALNLTFPEKLSKDKDYQMMIPLYYDSVQEILNDRYCSVY